MTSHNVRTSCRMLAAALACALALAGLGACVLAFNDWRKSRAASDHPASHEQPPAPAGA